MRQKLNFWIVGGDPRQAALARALAEDGHSVHTYALEQAVESTLSAPSLAGIEYASRCRPWMESGSMPLSPG